MFDEAFASYLKTAASTYDGILAGADFTGEMPLRIGINARRSDMEDVRNISIGGALLGGAITGPLTPAFVRGANEMDKTPFSSRAGIGKSLKAKGKGFVRGGVDGFIDAYKAPFKRGISRSARVGALAPFIFGAATQAVISSNQYRLGRKMRNKVESDVATRGFSGWWRRQMEAVPKID
jgi:hypothetical protein